MEKRRLWIRAVVIFLVVLMAVGIIAPILATKASTLSDLNGQYNALQKKLADTQKKLDSTKDKKEQQEDYKDSLEDKITYTRQQIDVINGQIDEYNADIAQKESDIGQKQKDIDEKTQLLKSRLRAMYMSSDTSILVLLFESKSFTDFLTASETISRIYKNDKDLINGLMTEKSELESEEQALQDSKASLEAKQNELSTSKAQLQNDEAECTKVIASLASQQKDLEAQIAKEQAQEDAMEAQIQAIVAQGSDMTDYVGGAFLWPLPGYTKANITCPFGWRYIQGKWNFHTGTDISGANVYGKPIVAANTGVVKYIKYDPNGGGNYLLLDHGGGTYTLYAHCSSIIVSTGQWVTRGQTIAYVGSTGWSTGAHLHFEIWINSKQVDPMTYF